MKVRITYTNLAVQGTHGGVIQQKKRIVSRDTYEGLIKPVKDRIGSIEGKKPKNRTLAEKIRLKNLKKALKPYGNFIVKGSPLELATHNGVLELPFQQGGITNVKVKFL